MQDIPHTPDSVPLRVEELTLGTQIGVYYTPLEGEQTGGADILSYNLQIDESGGGTGPWTNVQGYDSDFLETTVILSPLVEGKYYFFRYRVRNVHGWSDYSARNFILLANKPDQLLQASTVNNGILVDIIWQVTPFDRNSPVS